MFDWENMRYFMAVAREGTLSGAARTLRVDHATVSRRLGTLEAELQMQLVERLPRACRLTESGAQILELAQRMETAAFGIARHARAHQAPLDAKVTLSAPPVLATHFLARHLAGLRAAHPRIQLAVLAQPQQVSLSRREADIALRLVRPKESSNVIRRIGRMPFALYAHRDYAASVVPPDWTFIAYDESLADMPQQRWLLEVAGSRPVVCELSDISSHLAAARTGAGVAGLPCFIGDADADLVRLEHDGDAFARDIWLVVHRDLRRLKPVRVVMDYVVDIISRTSLLSID
ncbi:LysR family transcriptional regulator [Stenotrophomonas maltophilia]|nr:LysR family transcriptional regulator [Stenotrophomonas maltophilia]EKU9962309.1 LysR family transcriptional regulator [Stenotrophomonas maltophilia]MBA0337453.1 LysR family transcriptional regulator [Stenotrophomonas maltophilia]MBA0540852.1 LysR family transcriptional regulator [Stenotrophomonas maltophilia]MBH1741136.1 LysR family transcriptional regulator [Stenotrophomonas maltophilia]MBY8924917.1 LysR family transcriptional regulator [Stenotrophomonas maltophilia]